MDYQKFFSMLYFIDGITIVDTSGTIVFSINFNPELASDNFDADEVIGKSLSEVMPDTLRENSTLFTAMEKGIPVFKSRQTITTHRGNSFDTMNVSIPIRVRGRIVGAIELSRYLGSEPDTQETEIALPQDVLPVLTQHTRSLGSDTAYYTLADIITDDPEMSILKSKAEKFADSSSSVFICGETGTGKELFAHAIHNAGKRRGKPFITQNCAAIPETLLESIMFGTTRGSYTGAVESTGLFEAADGGTIFLDEIQAMPLHLQTKLLRVLQDGCVRRLGGGAEKRVDVRVISAANETPEECLRQKKIRRDMYYRLCVLNLHIPPLRNRKSDIELLLHFFITRYNSLLGTSIRAVSRDVMAMCLRYSWPGNIRELEHVVEYGLHMVEGRETTLRYEHVAECFQMLENVRWNAPPTEVETSDMKGMVRDLEIQMMRKALQETDWNYSRAAKMLGINRQTLQNKARQYNLV